MKDVKYRTLVESLKTEILGGRYGAKSPFPSVRALITRFGLSKTTVQRALDELFHQGLISRKQGRGTFVTGAASSGKIGLIVPGVAYSEFFPVIVSEINRLGHEAGYQVVIGEVCYSANAAARACQAKALARQYVSDRVAGVIFQPLELLPNASRLNEEILSLFAKARIPVVLIDADVVPSPARSAWDIVGINNIAAGRQMAAHLQDVGVRRVAFLADADSDCSIQDRMFGVRSVFGGRGAFSWSACDPRSVRGVGKLMKGRKAPQALICRSDSVAAHLMVTLRKCGIRVPDDVMVAGFNDINFAALLSPGLTTVHLPCAEIGAVAFNRLLTRIATPDLSAQEIYLSAPLVVRESTRRKK